MPPITVPFPNDGTATVRSNEAARIVNASANRETIVCTVTSRGGGVPTFVFTRDGVELLRPSSFPGHPLDRYQWILNKDDGTLPDGKSVFVLALSFTTTQYTFVMEHCDEFGARIGRVLKDIDYESANGEDTFAEAIQIFCE
jgi:hypothetical protein